MKFSLSVTFIILVVGGAAALLQRGKLTTLRDDHRELVGQAVKLGVLSESSLSSEDKRVTKKQREQRENHSRAMVADLVAFAKEMELHEKSGSKTDAAYDRRSREIMGRLIDLDAAELKDVISGLRDDPSLSSATRGNMIGISIMMLADDHPSAALTIYGQTSDLLGDSVIGQQVIQSTLARWAKDDPKAALAWVRGNAAAHPDLADEGLEQNVIAGAAEKDPGLAFKLLGGGEIDDPSSGIQSIMESGKTPEQRTAIVNALRDHLAKMPDEIERQDLQQESLENMGRNISNESFDTVNAWISSAKLTPEEAAQFASGLSYFSTQKDTGRWIDWMAQNLPKDQIADNVENLIGQWTQQDYLAAGKWLTASPAGPAKNAAVSTYAETVAEYEPQTAVQWALTLPVGEERKSTMQAIYENWPKKDADARAAFAAKNGIDIDSEAKGEP